MKILGLSAYYHDAAACVVVDGEIAAAAQEERFTRRKHDPSFPHHSIASCLAESGVHAKAIDHVVFYDKPFLKFERLLETYFSYAPKGVSSFVRALPVWLKEKLFLKSLICDELKKVGEADWEERILFSEHHLSHAASAFFPSPFEEAAVLTMDGVGEWATTSLAVGSGNRLEISREILFPHSLGLLYSALTYYTGFRVNSGEYKVMGLAPYGEPNYAGLMFDHLIDLKEDGSFWLDMSYFDYCTGSTMTNNRFADLFGGPPRKPEDALTQRDMDLAASIQKVTEEVILKLTRSIAKETGMRNLCLAGGVALNCVANGKVLRDGRFEKIWIQPAAGDAGGALGAALAGYHLFKGGERVVSIADSMKGSYLGPEYGQEEIEKRLLSVGANFIVLDESEMILFCAQGLAEGKALGWFQGRMEFGPRALGGRSILADSRSASMQSVLNQKVKRRESFRPFAPSVLREELSNWFELDVDSPYMLLVADVALKRRSLMSPAQQALSGLEKLNAPRSEIPAVTHVDYSARIQTVHSETNPKYHALISKFGELTGCPVIVNTSFNVRGEPIVASPEDAFRCFMGTGLDLLAIGNCILEKSAQTGCVSADHDKGFELD